MHSTEDTSPNVETPFAYPKHLPSYIHQEGNVDRERNGWTMRGARGPERWRGGVWVTGKGQWWAGHGQIEIG